MDESATPGPFRAVPWQRGVLDAFADSKLDWVVILKAAQMGVSELIRCAIGRWALLDPGDVLWVMATEAAADKAMAKLQAMFRNTPALRGLLPDSARGHYSKKGRKAKATLKELVLTNGMRIVIGWATSASSLASDPFRYVLLDETGLYPVKIGKEGSPIGLAEERVKTFGRRAKVVLLSKPAHSEDLICTAYNECLDKRQRRVPCPHCGEVQALDWEQARWPGGSPEEVPSDPVERLRLAAQVEADQSAYLECVSCAGEISDTHAADSDARSVWVTAGEGSSTFTSRRRAFHIDEIFHWSKTISDLVARFLRAIKPSDAQNFTTGSLGRPHVAERSRLRASIFAQKAIHEEGLVPEWATIVVSTADTQKDHWWYVVRAWGVGGRSRLLAWGRAETLQDLKRETLETAWPIEGTNTRAKAGILIVDSGGGTAGGTLDASRSKLVYEFASSTTYVTALKGTGEKRGAHEGQPITWRKIRFGREKELEVEIVCPHANWWKDELAAQIRSPLWEECASAARPEYGRQMTGQRQVWKESTSGHGHWIWEKRGRLPDHLWDCSYMQVVGAKITGADTREPISKRSRPRRSSAGRARRTEHRGPDGRPYHVGMR